MTTRAKFTKRRDKRREEAIKRQKARDSRSDAEQRQLLTTRRGESKKELARLTND